MKRTSDLLKENYTFVIPSYQRGYRWTEKEVKDLLNDLLNYIKQDDSGPYILQHLVVQKRKGEDNTWTVLDGQQRLTTVLLIMKRLIAINSTGIRNDGDDPNGFTDEDLYRLKYDEKESINIEDLNKDADIDSCYIVSAYETIKKWLTEKRNENRDYVDEITKALFYKNKERNKTIKFIWYELEENKEDDLEAIKAFNRINKGQIRLTNAELIKALFTLKLNKEEQDKFVLSYEQMERSLTDDFWYFLSNNSQVETRMDLLFDIATEKTAKAPSDYSYREYEKYYYDNNVDFSTLWDTVKETYNNLLYYYDTTEIYNYLGFISNFQTDGQVIEIINELNKNRKNEPDYNEDQVIGFLKEKIKMVLKPKAYLKDLLDEQTNEINYDILNYEDHKDLINRYLLLFNVINCTRRGRKFPYEAYKTESWDIEHITSQTDELLSKAEHFASWMVSVRYAINLLESNEELKSNYKEILSAVGVVDGDDEEALYEELKNVKKLKDIKQMRAFDRLKEGVEKNFSSLIKYDKHQLWNLTLLDSHTNRSYGNAPFPYKRMRVLERENNAKFVPICTYHLFLKQYSSLGKQASSLDVLKWTDDDAKAYKSAFEDVMYEYKRFDD